MTWSFPNGVLVHPLQSANKSHVESFTGRRCQWDQYLLFRSALVVWIATSLIAVAVYLLTRNALRLFHKAMVYQLGIASQTSTMIYKEVDQQFPS